MASVGRNRRKDSGILTKKNTQEKGKTTGRMASTIMETDDKSSDSEEEEQEKEVGRVTRGKLNKSCNKMAELKNKMKKKIKEKKIEISDPRSRIYSGNSSFVRKKLSSLKTNNRELASTLAASRHGVRKLQNQNLGLQRENHALAERVITLQGRVRELQAALRHKKDNEQEYKRKMLNVQSVLQKVSTSLLGTVEHIGSAMEVCHPALRDSGWRISSLSAGVSASDDSDGSLAPQPRLSVLGPGPARVPLPAGKRQSLAPPGNRASMRLSVSVPPPLLSTEPQESSVQQATPRDSIADLESAPILFTDEGTETDKQSTTDIAEPDNPACIAADIPDKPVDSSGQNTTKQAPPEVPEKRASLMDLVAEHKRKSRDATGQESCLSKSQESAVDPPAVTDPTDDTYTEQDMDLTVVPATVISTEETAQVDKAMEDASQETNTGRPADKDAKKNAVPKKGKTSQKDLNQSGCKPVRRVKKKKTSKLPTFVKSTKTTAERREEVGKDRDEIVDEERKTQEVPMQETSEGFSENADVAKSSQESETELEEFDADDTTYPKPVWALQQGQQVIPENSVPRRVSSLADDSDDNFVNKRGKKAARRIVSTDSESEIDRDMIAGLVSSENESRPDFAMKKKKQKGVTERNVKVSTKMTKKGLVVQSTSTKTSAKDVEDTTAASGQEKRGRESDSVFDLSSGDMFSEPSPLTLKPVVSREHTSQDDDHKQGHSRVGKPKKQGKSKKKVGSANKKKQDVLVTESESSDEEDEEENYARRGKTSKNRKDIPMIPETPGSLQEDDVRQQHVTGRRDTNRQSDEGHIARPRRRATTAVKYFTSDSESEDDCWQGRKSRQPRSTRRSSNYSLSEEEENTGTRMPLRRTPQRLLQSAEKGPLAARQGRVYRDSSDTDATTPHVEKASSKRRAFQDVGNTPQGHSDTAGTKTKVTPQTGPKNQKKRPFSSVGSCDEAPDVEQSHAVQNENAEDQSAGGAKRARRSRQQVSYKEPTLNSKLRRGDPMTIKFGDWSPQHQKNKHKTGKKFSK
ncbi:myosin-9-like isoform X3 [Branchiostoma lanceolatum]|uniref:myosin-9-like isoform X3 n=1 Tax=Branchiostoma lanceolatum TaxID=7740 RepID=UPI0034544A55